MYSTPRTGRAQLSLLPAARLCLYFGLFMVSFLVFRIGEAITYGDALLIAAFVITAFDTVVNGRRVPLPTETVAAFLFIFTGGILASLASADPAGSMVVLARVVLLAFLLPWTLRVLLTTPRRLHRAFSFFASGTAACGLGAVAQSTLGNVIPGSEVTSGGRYPGFAVHVSDTGGITSLAVVLGASLLLTKGREPKRLGVMVFMFGLAGLILSGSVSGMMASVVGGLALLIWHRLSLLKTALVSVAVIATAAWALSLMGSTEAALTPTERFQQVTGASGRGNTSQSRWDSIVAGWNGFTESAFIGVGLEPAASFTVTGLPAHNIVIAALFQGGLLFTVGLCMVAYRAARLSLRQGWAGGLHAAAAAGFVTAGVFAMTAPSFYNRYFWLPLALVLITSVYRPATSTRKQTLRVTLGPRPTHQLVKSSAR